MRLLDRIAAARTSGRELEKRYSADQWLTEYLFPAMTQFGYNGNQYLAGVPGLTTTVAGRRAAEVSATLPGYTAALRQCPPAFAAQMVRALVISQARFTFRNLPSSSQPRKTFGTRDLAPLERPWPKATTGEMLSRIEWHSGLAGNAYVQRRPDRLRILRPDWVAVVHGSRTEPDDAGYALDGELVGYVYCNGGFNSGNKPSTLLPEDVAHFCPLPDPELPHIGMSWITPAVREIQADRAATDHKLNYFLNGAPQPLDAKVLTPTGWSTMGEMRVGSQVIGSDGKSHDVVAVYPQGEQDIYRVTLSSGAQVECTADHLWSVATYGDRKTGTTRTMTLAQMVSRGVRYRSGPPKWSVPLVAPVEFDPAGDLPVDPYLMGSLLGDGYLGGNLKGRGAAELACHVDDIDEQIRLLTPLVPTGTRLVRHGGKGSSARITFAGLCGTMTTRTCDVDGCDRQPRALGLCVKHYQRPSVPRGAASRANPLTEALKTLGLWGVLGHEKSIPEQYLRGSVTERIALLQGLIDTDGSVEARQPNTVRFSNTSEKLCLQLVDLVGGLGGIATVRAHTNSSRSARARPQWAVNISRLPEWINPYRLSRKADSYRPSLRGGHRYIRSIELVGRKPAQCIGVDSSDHLYVTDDYVLTHNTPNLVVKGIPAVTKTQFDEIVEMMEDRHAGVANAYRTLYLTAGADATVVGSNLRDVDFKNVQGASETRIAVLSRVPAPLLGISEGLAGSSLNAGNFGMARRMFADTWVYPTLQDDAGTFADIINVPNGAELWFDTTDMPLLREDAKDAADIEQIKATTITMYVREGFTADSAIAAVRGQDVSLLKHSGLTSVQLQAPGSGPPTGEPAVTP